MGTSITWFLSMDFSTQIIQLRKERNMTQQALADAARLHVNQIKKYESGTAQPTLKALINVAKALHVSLDNLVFGSEERGPDEDLRLQFEALSQFTPEEKAIVRVLLESLILKHDASRFSRAS